MKTLFLTLIISLSALANQSTYNLKSSKISYTVNFPLKTVIGKTTEARGKAICEKTICELLVAAPVKSFKSGDTNRDVHMQEVTKAAQFSLISISSSNFNSEKLNNVSLEIDFAGVKKTIRGINFKKNVHEKITEIDADFSILLSDFKVERPTLLGVAIDDKVEIKVQTKWELQ